MENNYYLNQKHDPRKHEEVLRGRRINPFKSLTMAYCMSEVEATHVNPSSFNQALLNLSNRLETSAMDVYMEKQIMEIVSVGLNKQVERIYHLLSKEEMKIRGFEAGNLTLDAYLDFISACITELNTCKNIIDMGIAKKALELFNRLEDSIRNKVKRIQ